ncbi:hypothetical protein LLG10_05845 [bacterium]|nr:hypothetical protein [bacterium]
MKKYMLPFLVFFLCFFAISCNIQKTKNSNITDKNNIKFVISKESDVIDNIEIHFVEIIQIPNDNNFHFEYFLSNSNKESININVDEAFSIETDKKEFLKISKITQSTKDIEVYRDIENRIIELKPNDVIYIRITITNVDFRNIRYLNTHFISPISGKIIKFSYKIE